MRNLFKTLLLLLLIQTAVFANGYLEYIEDCTPFNDGIYEIIGYEGDSCVVTMTPPVPPNSNMQSYKFTYKFPQEILSDMVYDAKNMSKHEFRAKWEPKEEQFCTSINYGDKVLYSK